MPAVWTILDQYRKSHPGEVRPKIGIIDGGFTQNPAVKFGSMIGVKPLTFHTAGCGTHHGMHVAGIIGATPGDGPGTNGIIPDARMDAIAVEDNIVGDAGHVGVDEGWQVHALLFDDVLAKTLDYVYANLMQPDGLRVVNISLGYNFVASNLLGDADPSEVPGLALHILHQSNLIRLMASRVEGSRAVRGRGGQRFRWTRRSHRCPLGLAVRVGRNSGVVCWRDAVKHPGR